MPAHRRTADAIAALEALRDEAERGRRLDVWRRAQAVLGYLRGERVVVIAAALHVARTTVTDWLGWYARDGIDGLRTAKPGRSDPKLTVAQREELAAVLDAGPLASGFNTGLWTGKMVAAVTAQRFAVSFHPQSVPRLLHQMGFSVQRPRKRLARADPEAQAAWTDTRLPEIKKKRRSAGA